MKMTNAQMTEIGVLRFSKRLQSTLAENFPEWLWLKSEEALEEILRAITRANSHLLRTERECASFVLAWLLAGEDFDQKSEAVTETLASTSLSSREKASWIDEWIKFILAAMTYRGLP